MPQGVHQIYKNVSGLMWCMGGGRSGFWKEVKGVLNLTCLLIIFHNEFAFLYYMCNLQR